MGNILSHHVKTIDAFDYLSTSAFSLSWNEDERLALVLLFEKCGWTTKRRQSSALNPASLSSSPSTLMYSRDLKTMQGQWLHAHQQLESVYFASSPLMISFLDHLFSCNVQPTTRSTVGNSFPFPPLDLLLHKLGNIFKSKSCTPGLTLVYQSLQPAQCLDLVYDRYEKFTKSLPDALAQSAGSRQEVEEQWLKPLIADSRNAHVYLKASQSFFYETLLCCIDTSVMMPTFPRRACHSDTLLSAFFIWYLSHSLQESITEVTPAHTRTSSAALTWYPVYRLQTHGQNWHAFTEAIIKAGNTPLLFIVKDTRGFIFGASTWSEHGWKMSPHFTGESSTRLFTLSPKVSMYTSSGQNTHYYYLNDGTASLPNGLAFGGQLNYFGLFIASDLLSGTSEPSCSTFGPCFQSLASSPQFQIENIEVWSLDGQAYAKNSATCATPTRKSAMTTQGEFLNVLDLGREPIRSREGRTAAIE